ncbi:MAG: hypothetical protein AAF682_03715 [Planctomycetota bacterium]
MAIALLRLWKLGDWSLWHDEALTLSDALDGVGMQNRLGYLLYAALFGGAETRPDELQLRLLPAVLGILTVPLTYWAFRPFVAARHAAAAALLVALSTWHVYWSQNARFYTLAQDLALVGGGLFVRGLYRPRTALVVVGVALVAAAALAHPSAAFLLGGLLAGPWVARAVGLGPERVEPGPWRATLLLAGVGALAGLPWAREVWDTWVGKKDPNAAHFLFTTGFYVTPAIGVGVLLGTWTLLRRRERAGSAVLAATVATFALAFGASLFARMSAQYVFVLLPWIAFVAAAPVGAFTRRGFSAVPGGLGLAYLALLVLPALANLLLYFTVAHGDRPRWRDAYAYVLTASEPGDLILGMEAPVAEYYLDPDPARMDVREWRQVAYLDRFRANLSSAWGRYPRRTWLVLNREQLEDWGRSDRESFLRNLRDEFRLIEAFPVRVLARDLDVLVYLRE